MVQSPFFLGVALGRSPPIEESNSHEITGGLEGVNMLVIKQPNKTKDVVYE